MPHTYTPYSEKLDKYYIGSTIDKDERLKRNNRGAEEFTSKGIPWQIVYYKTFELLQDARKREREIKKKKSRIYVEALINNSFPG